MRRLGLVTVAGLLPSEDFGVPAADFLTLPLVLAGNRYA